jgi:hypothetical protein
MNDIPAPPPLSRRHQSPPLGPVALTFVILFAAALVSLGEVNGLASILSRESSAEALSRFFQTQRTPVLFSAFFQFGAAVPLGVFTASVVSRLQFLGIRAAGIFIALCGGFMAAITLLTSAATLWTLAHAGVVQDPALVQALSWLTTALGGPGFTVPFALLIAGIAVPAWFMRLLPRWLVVVGMGIAACGELSWTALVSERALVLVPLSRFPGFAWVIVTGFMLPSAVRRAADPPMPHARPA